MNLFALEKQLEREPWPAVAPPARAALSMANCTLFFALNYRAKSIAPPPTANNVTIDKPKMMLMLPDRSRRTRSIVPKAVEVSRSWRDIWNTYQRKLA